jgi:sulfhydrogenase subunit alpha
VTHRTIETGLLARVEGESALHVRIEDGVVADVRLDIFEPPRYFERLLVGRRYGDVLDITARICGICPVAYQMTAAHAFEQLFGTEVAVGTRELRRLMYCGEWIQSHMLHVHLLAASDFLGFSDALAMAARHPEPFARGFRLQGLGSDLMAAIGGRAVHPVTPVVGGFSRAPRRSELEPLVLRFRRAADDILDVADWVATFDVPSMTRPSEMLALVHPGEYPLNEGVIATSTGSPFPAADFELVTEDVEVPHSTARHAHLRPGRPAVVGPLARLNLNPDRLTPLAREAAARLSWRWPEPDPFRSLAARVIETALAVDEALALLERYEPPAPARAPVTPCAGRATWVTEAPRGLLYHRFDVDESGIVHGARIVPPTSHNLPNMESDVRCTVAAGLNRSDAELQRLCEMAVRNYDPCISCATHFLHLRLDRA